VREPQSWAGRTGRMEGDDTMFAIRAAGLALGMAGALAAGLATSATAGGSIKDGPVEPGRQLEWSFNIGATTDYVFRGISQTLEDPAFQAGIDLSYGIFYVGVWGSTVDFGGGPPEAEIDYYAGIKPEWRGVEFDLGVIYYTYPNAKDSGAELDYVELKVGASGSPVENLTIGGTVFYSPDYTAETGEVWTFEGSVAYEFRKMWVFTPTLSALIGYQTGKASKGFLVDGITNDDDYLYWNAGLELAVEKLTLDFRYWDTDIGTANGGLCAATKLCDERFVFTAKVTF
jgi:uncharacterized protein (TIGR02001 family)